MDFVPLLNGEGLGLTPAEARAEMARYDWDPKDDREVTRYLDEHIAEIVAGLVERGVLEHAPDELPRINDY